MESRIPLPTDNVYKFYALFGLLLLVFSIGALLYTTQATNERIFALYPQLEGLKQSPQPTAEQKARIAVLERTLEISNSDKKFVLNALGVTAGVAILVGGLGFLKWQFELQPIQDRMANAQAELAELQLVKLKRELGLEDKKEAPVPNTERTPTPATVPATIQSDVAPNMQPQVI